MWLKGIYMGTFLVSIDYQFMDSKLLSESVISSVNTKVKKQLFTFFSFLSSKQMKIWSAGQLCNYKLSQKVQQNTETLVSDTNSIFSWFSGYFQKKVVVQLSA